jgi:hypothetical protein
MRVELGPVLRHQDREVGPLGIEWSGLDCSPTSTSISVWPVGSRNQNSGGTGSPIRETSASTSTPSAFSCACVASMSVVVSVMPVWAGTTSPPSGGGGASAMPVPPSGG